ncbi:MAG: hypothetical protein IKC49_01255 [Clostridia bacterium]|nr:hypothetical protein [Clostridia bacterium]
MKHQESADYLIKTKLKKEKKIERLNKKIKRLEFWNKYFTPSETAVGLNVFVAGIIGMVFFGGIGMYIPAGIFAAYMANALIANKGGVILHYELKRLDLELDVRYINRKLKNLHNNKTYTFTDDQRLDRTKGVDQSFTTLGSYPEKIEKSIQSEREIPPRRLIPDMTREYEQRKTNTYLNGEESEVDENCEMMDNFDFDHTSHQ